MIRTCRIACVAVIVAAGLMGMPNLADAQAPDTEPAEQQVESPSQADRDAPDNDAAADEEARSEEDLATRAKELGKETVRAVDRNEAVRKATDAAVQSSENLTGQASESWHFVAFTVCAAAVVSFAIQVLGSLIVIFRFRFLDLKELGSDCLALFVSLIAVSFVLQSGETHDVLVTRGSMVAGATVAAALMGLFLGIWGVRQQFESCRTAEVLEELAETKSEYNKLRVKATKMSATGKKLLEEKKRREQGRKVGS